MSPGFIPGQITKIPQAAQHGQKEDNLLLGFFVFCFVLFCFVFNSYKPTGWLQEQCTDLSHSFCPDASIVNILPHFLHHSLSTTPSWITLFPLDTGRRTSFSWFGRNCPSFKVKSGNLTRPAAFPANPNSRIVDGEQQHLTLPRY